MNGWITMSLGSLADVMIGQVPSADSINKSGDGLPYYSGSGDISAGMVKQYCTRVKRIVPKGAILLSIRQPFGVADLVKEDCCIGRGIAAVLPYSASIDPEYLLYYLRVSKDRLESMAQGSTTISVNTKALTTIGIAFPESLEEQRRIADVVRRAHNLLIKHDEARATIEQLYETIANQAFSGRLAQGGV